MDPAPPAIQPNNAFHAPETKRILAFLAEIGIPTATQSLDQATFMPGMTVRHGTLTIDPERLIWPGDLLHEAGHIAVTDPAQRPTLTQVSSDPGEEMAAMAWSYAAALAISIDARVVFHDGGYQNGGTHLADVFESGGLLGQPLLHYYGMTIVDRHAEQRGERVFPHMLRWLR